MQQEQDKYIDFRYNKGIVKKLTGLKSPALDSFMVKYRPDYYFVQARNDLELYQYIWEAVNNSMRCVRKKILACTFLPPG